MKNAKWIKIYWERTCLSARFDKIFNNRNFPDKGLTTKYNFCLYKLGYCLNTSFTMWNYGAHQRENGKFRNRPFNFFPSESLWDLSRQFLNTIYISRRMKESLSFLINHIYSTFCRDFFIFQRSGDQDSIFLWHPLTP